ncbi:MAG TPA: acyltransferase family protein [Steroidobacteraceae bacterium]
MANPPHIAYRPDIDGLRAIAVLAVLLFHAFPACLPGGFVGVDIFFVISGFLISGILFDGLEKGSFSFVEFYSRRIRRIFPALALVCAACLIFGWFALLPDEYRQLGTHVAGGAGFLSNFVLLRESGYFDIDAKLKPLLHLWSLGIEEQYYLVWPAALFLCRRRRRTTALLLVLVGGVSFALNLYYTGHDPSLAYYVPFTRFWELMIGSALAFAARNATAGSVITGGPLANLKSIAGVLALTLALILINETRPFPGWWALLACAGAFLLICAGPEAWFNRRILASRPMVWTGLISYPLYLWHWPILSFGIIISRTPSIGYRIAALAASVALAALTYHFIELPVRRGKVRPKLRRVTLQLLGSMAVVGVVGASARYDIVRPISAGDPRDVEISTARHDGYFHASDSIPGTVKNTALFFGDSHMQQYWPRIELLTRRPGKRRTVELRTLGGCAPIPLVERAGEPCLAFVNSGFARAAAPDVDVVVIAASWKGFAERGDYYRPGLRNAAPLDMLAPDTQWVYDGFADALAHLRQLGKRVVVLSSSPRGYAFEPGRMVDRSRLIPRVKPAQIVYRAAMVAFLSPIDSRIRAAAQKAGVEILDPDDWLCTATVCPTVDSDGRPLYQDGTHIRATTARDKATGLDQFVLLGP